MRVLALVAVLVCLAYARAQSNDVPNDDPLRDSNNIADPEPDAGCCLAQTGGSCSANRLQKQHCPLFTKCCPDSIGPGVFQCCLPGYRCNFTAQACQYELNFPLSPKHVKLNLGIFSPGIDLTLGVNLGYFEDEGITLNITRVQGSVQQFQVLNAGGFDFIDTALDNVINYVRNSNPPFSNFTKPLDLLAFYGNSRSVNQSIFVNPNGPYPTLASFKQPPPAGSNRTKPIVGVDSPTSGFAYLVYNVFATLGLQNGTDYIVKAVGGAAARQTALKNMQIDAGILGGENAIEAEEVDGEVAAINVFKVIGNLEGAGYASNRTFLDPFGIPGIPNPVAIRLIRALYRAREFTVNPANRDYIIKFLAASGASVDPARFLDANLDPNTGLTPRGVIIQSGSYKLLQLRNNGGGFETPTSQATLCALSQPRGGRFRIGQSQDQFYELDTLAYATESLGQKFIPPTEDPTCKSLPPSLN